MLSSLVSGIFAIVVFAAEHPDKSAMQLTSSAFAEGQPIPAKYSCDDRNVSPPLKWTGTPESAKRLALIADDPDAPVGTWVHWVLYDLPANTTELPEDLPKGQYTPGGGKQGLNDFKHLGYGGPCPPFGSHRYVFRLYVLDTTLEKTQGASRENLLRAMKGHVVANGRLTGKYARSK